MTKSRKYAYNLVEEGSLWNAEITRQVSSKKTVVSKLKEGFKSESEAQDWAEQELLEFATTLGKSNQRHGEQRKHLEEVRRQRSNRRADKTLQAKKEIEKVNEETDMAADD